MPTKFTLRWAGVDFEKSGYLIEPPKEVLRYFGGAKRVIVYQGLDLSKTSQDELARGGLIIEGEEAPPGTIVTASLKNDQSIDDRLKDVIKGLSRNGFPNAYGNEEALFYLVHRTPDLSKSRQILPILEFAEVVLGLKTIDELKKGYMAYKKKHNTRWESQEAA